MMKMAIKVKITLLSLFAPSIIRILLFLVSRESISTIVDEFDQKKGNEIINR
jgi:hypothetical protein